MTMTGEIPPAVLDQLESLRIDAEQAELDTDTAAQAYADAREALGEAMRAVGQTEEIYGRVCDRAAYVNKQLVDRCKDAGVVRTADGFRLAAAGESEDDLVCCGKRHRPPLPGKTFTCPDCGTVWSRMNRPG